MNFFDDDTYPGGAVDTSMDILIVDDNLLSGTNMRLRLFNLGCKNVRVRNSAEGALQTSEKQRPDLVLLESGHLGKSSGINLAHLFKKMGVPTLFVTRVDNEKTYRAALRAGPLGYLLKPVNDYTLVSALRMANVIIQKVQSPESENVAGALGLVSAGNKNRLQRVRLTDVLCVRAHGTYCELLTSDSKFIINQPIKVIEDRLSSADFYRCHRQYIIRIDKVKVLRWEERILEVGRFEVPLSRRKGSEMRRLFLGGKVT